MGHCRRIKGQFRLKSISEYSTPVLGLIFLRYADYKFTEAEQMFKGKSGSRHDVTKEDYQAKGILLFLKIPGSAKSLISTLTGRPSQKFYLLNGMVERERFEPD
jgi:hypothetical protein